MEHFDQRQDAGDGLERRAVPRRRVLLGASLTFNRGYGAFECVIRNESSTGAHLQFGDTSAVPRTFELRRNGDPVSREATVRWRRPTELGIEFKSRAATTV